MNGSHAEGESIAEPRRASPNAANAGGSWEEERDGEFAGGATEIMCWQRAQPLKDGAKVQTKLAVFFSVGQSRQSSPIMPSAGSTGITTSVGRSCGFEPAKGGNNEAKRARAREYSKRYYEQNRDKHNEAVKRWREQNKERYTEAAKVGRWRYYERNREKEKLKSKRWREENKEKVNHYNEKRKEKVQQWRGMSMF